MIRSNLVDMDLTNVINEFHPGNLIQTINNLNKLTNKQLIKLIKLPLIGEMALDVLEGSHFPPELLLNSIIECPSPQLIKLLVKLIIKEQDYCKPTKVHLVEHFQPYTGVEQGTAEGGDYCINANKLIKLSINYPFTIDYIKESINISVNQITRDWLKWYSFISPSNQENIKEITYKQPIHYSDKSYLQTLLVKSTDEEILLTLLVNLQLLTERCLFNPTIQVIIDCLNKLALGKYKVISSIISIYPLVFATACFVSLPNNLIIDLEKCIQESITQEGEEGEKQREDFIMDTNIHLHSYYHHLQLLFKNTPTDTLLKTALTSHPSEAVRIRMWRQHDWDLDHLPLMLHKLNSETALVCLEIVSAMSLLNSHKIVHIGKILSNSIPSGLILLKYCHSKQPRIWHILKSEIVNWIKRNDVLAMGVLYQVLKQTETLGQDALVICIHFLPTLSDEASALAIECINLCIQSNITDIRAVWNVALKQFKPGEKARLSMKNYWKLVGLASHDTFFQDFCLQIFPHSDPSSHRYFPETWYETCHETAQTPDSDFLEMSLRNEIEEMSRTVFRGLNSNPSSSSILAENVHAMRVISQPFYDMWKKNENLGLKSGLVMFCLHSFSLLLDASSLVADVQRVPREDEEVFRRFEFLLGSELNRIVTYAIRDLSPSFLGDHVVATRMAVTGAFCAVYQPVWKWYPPSYMEWFWIRLVRNFELGNHILNSVYAVGGFVLSLRETLEAHLFAEKAVDLFMDVLGNHVLSDDLLAALLLNVSYSASLVLDAVRKTEVVNVLRRNLEDDFLPTRVFAAFGLGLLGFEEFVEHDGLGKGLALCVSGSEVSISDPIGSLYVSAWRGENVVCNVGKMDANASTHVAICEGWKFIQPKFKPHFIAGVASYHGWNYLLNDGVFRGVLDLDGIVSMVHDRDLKVARQALCVLGRLCTMISRIGVVDVFGGDESDDLRRFGEGSWFVRCVKDLKVDVLMKMDDLPVYDWGSFLDETGSLIFAKKFAPKSRSCLDYLLKFFKGEMTEEWWKRAIDVLPVLVSLTGAKQVAVADSKLVEIVTRMHSAPFSKVLLLKCIVKADLPWVRQVLPLFFNVIKEEECDALADVLFFVPDMIEKERGMRVEVFCRVLENLYIHANDEDVPLSHLLAVLKVFGDARTWILSSLQRLFEQGDIQRELTTRFIKLIDLDLHLSYNTRRKIVDQHTQPLSVVWLLGLLDVLLLLLRKKVAETSIQTYFTMILGPYSAILQNVEVEYPCLGLVFFQSLTTLDYFPLHLQKFDPFVKYDSKDVKRLVLARFYRVFEATRSSIVSRMLLNNLNDLTTEQVLSVIDCID